MKNPVISMDSTFDLTLSKRFGRTPKPRAEGSSPSAPAKENATTARVVAFFRFGASGGKGVRV